MWVKRTEQDMYSWLAERMHVSPVYLESSGRTPWKRWKQSCEGHLLGHVVKVSVKELEGERVGKVKLWPIPQNGGHEVPPKHTL